MDLISCDFLGEWLEQRTEGDEYFGISTQCMLSIMRHRRARIAKVYTRSMLFMHEQRGLR